MVTVTILTEEEALAQFRTLVATFPSQRAFARLYKMDVGYLNTMLTGINRLSPKALAMIHCERAIVSCPEEHEHGRPS